MGRRSDARLRLMVAAHELIWSHSYGAITVERICERAQVRKGSFYHFFDSKSDLAAMAVTAWWEKLHLVVKELFRSEMPPLERIRNYFDRVTQNQLEAYEENGQILGCPLFSLGSEICTQDERLRSLIEKILQCLTGYFEKAIQEAQRAGEIAGNDAARQARLLWAVYEGTLTRARIENDPERVRTLGCDACALLQGSLVAAASKRKENRSFSDLVMRWKNADERVVLTDAVGRVTWINDPFMRMCGYSFNELLGKKPGALLQGPRSDREAVETLRHAVRTGHACECRIVNYKKDGSPYSVHIKLGPIYRGDSLDGFLAIETLLSEDE